MQQPPLSCAELPTGLRAAEPRRDFGALGLARVQPGGTILRAERVHRAETWHERVVHVVVELEKRLVEIWALTDLRTNGDQLTAR